MSSLNNGVGNIKGTPAMLTDTLANRPSAEILAVGTIFIDSATGNWYQVGTNNTWGSTGGGGGGTADLQSVLDNGNQAVEQQIYLINESSTSVISINASDDLTNFIYMYDYEDPNLFLKIQQSGAGNVPVMVINGSDTPNSVYNRIGYDYIECKNGNERGILSSANNGIEYVDSITGETIQNLSFQNNIYFKVTTGAQAGFGQKIRALSTNFNNQIIDIPKYSGTIATAQIVTANTISLTSSNYTVPTVTTQDYFIITAGSGINSIILTTGLINLVSYKFLNKVNNSTFTTNTGGTIYGVSSSLPAGIVEVIRNGNDFYITHP